ncbi:TPA: multidrug ABC transporter substrate-binding protein [bacterium UBP9_UBA11836]|nr:multidrug ABC transporter substrate-binding protein [bacterium UBP9_UBA11836]
MSWFMIVRIAGLALLRNKMRSFLTMLGIIIGVSTVITMVALGTGTQNSIQSSIANLGTNTITVSAWSVRQGGARSGAYGSSRLTVQDSEAIRESVPDLAQVSPITQNTAQVIFQEQNWSTTVVGCAEGYQAIKSWNLTRGRFITDEDVRGRVKVCVLGATVADELFASANPIGQSVRINKTPVLVVGVLEAKGAGGFGPSQDDTVLVPYTTAMYRLFSLRYLRNIQCSAKSEDTVDTCVDDITALLRARHRLQDSDEDDFRVNTQAELASMMAESTQTFTLFLGGIASVSLLVGGIGIMNIMLVSVTERIREIGIRMALGAKGSDILRQFLVESLMLSLVGGVIGVILAFILTTLASKFMSMSMQISPAAIAMAVVFSATVGVFFGLYPAVQASKLDPIQALRHE